MPFFFLEFESLSWTLDRFWIDVTQDEEVDQEMRAEQDAATWSGAQMCSWKAKPANTQEEIESRPSHDWGARLRTHLKNFTGWQLFFSESLGRCMASVWCLWFKALKNWISMWHCWEVQMSSALLYRSQKLRDGVESVSTGYLLVVFLLTKICFFPTVLPALVPVSALSLSLHLSPTFRLSCVSFYLQLCSLRW